MTQAEIIRCIEMVDQLKEAGRPGKELASHEANLSPGKSAKKTAAIVGVSQATVERTRTVLSDPAVAQEVKGGLSEGKTPYSIGKDLSAWVEKLFETSIPADTLKKRAQRIADKELGTNVPTPPTTCNLSETPDNQVPEVKHGGKREGAGYFKNILYLFFFFTNMDTLSIFVLLFF